MQYVSSFENFQGSMNEAAGTLNLRKEITAKIKKMKPEGQKMAMDALKAIPDTELQEIYNNLVAGETKVQMEFGDQKAEVDLKQVSKALNESVEYEDLNEGFKEVLGKMSRAALWILGAASWITGAGTAVITAYNQSFVIAGVDLGPKLAAGMYAGGMILGGVMMAVANEWGKSVADAKA